MEFNLLVNRIKLENRSKKISTLLGLKIVFL